MLQSEHGLNRAQQCLLACGSPWPLRTSRWSVLLLLKCNIPGPFLQEALPQGLTLPLARATEKHCISILLHYTNNQRVTRQCTT
jgi:hypothetical protein